MPAGWVLVPVEPTKAMLEEACFVDIEIYPTNIPSSLTAPNTKEARDLWSAFLRATPTPPIEGRDTDVERVLSDAADYLRQYAEFIRTEVKADDFERHPYLPSIDYTAAALLALGERG